MVGSDKDLERQWEAENREKTCHELGLEKQIAQLKAQVERLREWIEYALNNEMRLSVIDEANERLNETPAQSLNTIKAEPLEDMLLCFSFESKHYGERIVYASDIASYAKKLRGES